MNKGAWLYLTVPPTFYIHLRENLYNRTQTGMSHAFHSPRSLILEPPSSVTLVSYRTCSSALRLYKLIRSSRYPQRDFLSIVFIMQTCTWFIGRYLLLLHLWKISSPELKTSMSHACFLRVAQSNLDLFSVILSRSWYWSALHFKDVTCCLSPLVKQAFLTVCPIRAILCHPAVGGCHLQANCKYLFSFSFLRWM